MTEKTVKAGQRVEIPSKETLGTVAFVGTTNFSQGKWIGVILDEKKGKNNGTVQGKSYYQCEDGYGIFVRSSQLNLLDQDGSDAESTVDSSSRLSLSLSGTTPGTEKLKSRRISRSVTRSMGTKPTSSIKRKIEPTSLKRKPIGNQVPQKPDRLRLPTMGRISNDRGYSLSPMHNLPSVPRSRESTASPSPYAKSNLTKSRSSSTQSLDSPNCTISSFKKPSTPALMKSRLAKKSFPTNKLPLGSGSKIGTPRSKEDRTPIRESPRQEMKKAPSFVEDIKQSPSLRSLSSECSSIQENADDLQLETPSSQTLTQTGFVENITPQYTPGATMHTLEEKANAMQAHQEIENLKAEIKDLNEKLETIKIKRNQDREKLKEGDKLKLQVEQLLEFKSRIMDSQALLQKELQKSKLETKEAIEAKERHEEETEELTENVEMLTLDKEMAEEKAEGLQLEIDSLNEKIEELTLDLEILKAEDGDEAFKIEGKSSTVQVKQLEQQNTRLHETLVRMRDFAARDKHELQKLQKEMENKKSEIQEVGRSKEKFAAQVTELEETIADLQEQVDAALGAEEMVETLTDRNLDLEERVAELLETVSDLEAINDMNDQLQEDTRELELELREELDMANSKTREVLKEKEASNEVIVDQDSTIKKFRDLVQKMQEQNLELRHSLEKETNKPLGTPSEIIDFKKMFTETKAHSKAIDLELRRLEVQQANIHVTYLTHYLPDTFMTRGGDHDAVLVLLLLPRMVWKCEIIINGLKDQYQAPESISRSVVLKSHVVDQYSFSCRMLQMLYMLQTVLRQYIHVLNSCTVEVFLKMGLLYPEMAVQERSLDFYVDLLRKDQLDENVTSEHLEKAVTYFQTVYPTHLSGEKLDQTNYLADVIKVINSAAEAVSTESARIEALLPPPEGSSEVTQLLTFLKSSCQEISNYAKRIRRRLPQDGSSGPVHYPESVEETLARAMSNTYCATRALRHVAKACMQQTTLCGDVDGGIPSDKVKELVHQATDLIYTSEDQGPESLKLSLNRTQEDFFKIADTLEKGEYDFDGTKDREAIPPMSLRAEAIKNELKDTEHLKYKLENKEQDLKEMKVLLKQCKEELSQMTVRRDMAEKKLSSATRDSDITIEKLQRKLDDSIMMLRRKEKEFEETMDHLQADIESLEFEKGELREKLKTLNKKTIYEALSKSSPSTGGMSPSSPTTPTSVMGTSSSNQMSSNGPVVVKDSPLLLQQISDLKMALQDEKYAKWDLMSSDIKKKLASLKPLPKDSDSSNKDRINRLIKETEKLKLELNYELIGFKVIDVSKPSPDRDATLVHKKYLIEHEERVLRLKNRIKILQDEVAKLLAEKTPGGCIQTPFTSFPTPQLTKALAEKDLVTVGNLSLPGRASKSVKVVLTPEQLRTLHLTFLS